jgi:hypothetical protein
MRGSGAPHLLVWIFFGLIDSDIVDLKGGREVVTHVWRKSTTTFLFATIETIAFASHRTRLREAPGFAHGCVKDQIPVAVVVATERRGRERSRGRGRVRREGGGGRRTEREIGTDIGSSGMSA